ncbi:sigma-70 family RNA polymerase sigma factor [Alicyclobacillus fructus]|uniref:sigma-70 family RNA polymerase sigma factor n=1 Tax=Alicyclobacillus fructus TaxID=2816082 RepID=UPI001A8BFAE3|nr:sigma-70 family RNA polymerase sigma factor [Alicyclobacillus fructus]
MALNRTYEAYEAWSRQREQERVEQHLPLVYRCAQQLVQQARAVGLELADLTQTGVLALYRAAASFDETRSSTFGSYAKWFVRGAMLDEIAKCRNESRAVRDKYREIRRAEERLAQRLMREPTLAELAQEMNVDVSKLSEWYVETGIREPASLDELAERGEWPEPADEGLGQPELHFLAQEEKSRLVEALSQLSQREQQLLYLYYQEELTFKEIGYVLDISESQASRIHKQALARLRAILEDGERSG